MIVDRQCTVAYDRGDMLNRNYFVLVVLSLSQVALANDGFYQGSGSELKPITNQALQVVSERLRISFLEPNICYPVLYKGKKLKYDQKHAIDDSKIHLGSKSFCPTGKVSQNLSSQLRTMWHAEAEYLIRAKTKVTCVQFGFPVPQWETRYTVNDDSNEEGLHEVNMPAVANFRTSIDGHEVKKLEIKNLVISTSNNKSSPGYTWLASFAKVGEYRLKTTYDFGANYSAQYFEGSQYLKGRRPWFLPNDDKISGPMMANGAHSAMHLLYYLTPLNSWGPPPPSSVQIEIHFPKSVPVEFAVPLELSPNCVDNRLWTFEIKNAVPSREIDVSLPWMNYPRTTSDLPKMQTWAEWQAWISVFDKGVQISCSVKDRISKNMALKDLPALQAFPCVQSCFEK